MNWSKATNKMLADIAYRDKDAPLADKAEARNELFRRGRKRSGKLTMHTKELFRR